MVQGASNSVILAQKKIKQNKTKQKQTTEKQTNKLIQGWILLFMLL